MLVEGLGLEVIMMGPSWVACKNYIQNGFLLKGNGTCNDYINKRDHQGS